MWFQALVLLFFCHLSASQTTVPHPGLPCGYDGYVTTTSDEILSPGWPQNYHNDIDCPWEFTAETSGYYMELKFYVFGLENSYDYLMGYVNDESVFNFTGDSLPQPWIVEPGKKLRLRFLSDDSVSGAGFNATIREISPEAIVTTTTALTTTTTSPVARCGGDLQVSSTRRTLQSPGYPRGYPNSIECIWTMRTTRQLVINLEFTAFTTEVCCDYLSVAENGNVTNHLTGYKAGRTYQSNTNVIVLKFESDSSINDRGFNISYYSTIRLNQNSTTTLESTTSSNNLHNICGFDATAHSFNQSLQSPGYPLLYPSNSDCTWHIVAPPGWQIIMVFDNINTEFCCDILRIYEETTQVFSIQGMLSIRVYRSRTNRIRLHFTSDGSITQTGFNSVYYAVPEIPMEEMSTLAPRNETLPVSTSIAGITTETFEGSSTPSSTILPTIESTTTKVTPQNVATVTSGTVDSGVKEEFQSTTFAMTELTTTGTSSVMNQKSTTMFFFSLFLTLLFIYYCS